MLDPLGPLYTMLLEEMEILKAHHVTARTNPDKWVEQYGQPFDQGNTNRLTFWGAQKKVMPLLFYVASTLITAPAASTDNERAHSVGGLVVSKTRCSLVGDSVDRNTCGYIWLRKNAAARAEELKKMGFAPEDLEDHPSIRTLVQEEEEGEEVIEVDDAAAGGAGAGGGAGGAAGAAAQGAGGARMREGEEWEEE